ncbi:tripartite tricarboxylate transporter substrate-binding protein [Cupriavidus necator]|uniref:tripartite tricarboxylate transporter substrate-binding protein n=1 Tax=Cupriavidus necator TaxID=106590 RepID=UPI003AF3FA4D
MGGDCRKKAAEVSALHVPYRGSAPVMNDLIGGQVEFAFDGMTTTSPFVKSGKLRAIAQTGSKRPKAFSDVPTVAESGYPGFNASIWFGLVGPARTPAAMVGRINSDVNKVLSMPDVIARLEEFGAEDALLAFTQAASDSAATARGSTKETFRCYAGESGMDARPARSRLSASAPPSRSAHLRLASAGRTPRR